MTCKAFRNQAMRQRASSPPLAEHLSTCRDCAAFASRLDAIRGSLRAPASEISPGPAFASRVQANLPRGSEMLGWAALRALPAALVVALALAWMSYSEPPSVETVLSAEPSPDLLLTAGALAPETQR